MYILFKKLLHFSLSIFSFFEDQPTDLLDKKVKTVFVYRNIKDLAVSYYHHHTRFEEYKYKDSFSHYIRRFVAGLGEQIS